jgi:hypothetical protein
MEKVIKNAFLPEFYLCEFFRNFERGASPDFSKTLFWPKNSKKSPKIFLSALLYEMFPLCDLGWPLLL